MSSKTFCTLCRTHTDLQRALDTLKQGKPELLQAILRRMQKVNHNKMCQEIVERALSTMPTSDNPDVVELMKEAMYLREEARVLWDAIKLYPEGADVSSYDMAYQATKKYHQVLTQARELQQALSAGLEDEPVDHDFNAVDDERVLYQLIDIQERMAKGMKMIDEANKNYIEQFFKNHRWMGTLYNCWSGKEKDQTKRERFLGDERNSVFVKWFEYRKNLWAKWNELKHEGDVLVSTVPNPNVFWGKHFFGLKEMIFDPYWSTVDSEKIDNQVDLYDKMMTDKATGENYLFEMNKAEKYEQRSRYEDMSYQKFKGSVPHWVLVKDPKPVIQEVVNYSLGWKEQMSVWTFQSAIPTGKSLFKRISKLLALKKA